MALKPWREIIAPHPDVAAGRYQQAEFAADLAEVVRGDADAEYQDPAEFFARTYLTEGMRRLLVTAVERVSGKGGEPVVQLKTAFGGGKTHTLLSLYHLLNRKATAKEMPGVEAILKDAGVQKLPEARLVVLVGTALNPAQTRRVNGVKVHTLWGEIAAQIGGADAYELVAEADHRGVSPGADALTDLFNQFGPALILIDELIAYIRNLYTKNDLPGGSFDSNLTFVQSLTEAAKRSKRSMVVASIPESDVEVGGEGGKAALARIEHIFKRLEAIWKPVGAMESFEVVRRRLFTPVADAVARDEVCRAFTRLYDENPTEFPPETREANYLERLRGAYPIHPELFERLYEDWSSLEQFQRTRGVLRLMAAVIHELWSRNDRSLLIMPGSVPLDDPRVRDELLQYLPEGWNALVDKDVDGANSEPRTLDESNPRLGALLAARRVARTIFLGSAPSVKQQSVRGIEDVRVRLGVVQPNEQVAVFNDALAKLVDRLTYLYGGNRRYWYDTQPNLRRTMEDRAGKLDAHEVEEEIVRRLRLFRERGEFATTRIAAMSADVPDEDQVCLVVLAPSQGHRANRLDSGAITAATEILDKRGSSPRTYRNMLIFLAPDAEVMSGLEQETRRYLAWKSIVEDVHTLNLDAHQRDEAERGRERSDETVSARLNEAYSWLLVPTQEGTNPLTWEPTRIGGAQENPLAKANKRIKSSEQLITKWSPALLRMELDRWLWGDKSHVSLKWVWECLATYPYFPRLRDQEVFLMTVREGIRGRDYFGYANNIGADGRYQTLQIGSAGGSIYLDEQSVLVKPEAAFKQIELEAVAEAEKSLAGGTTYPTPETGQGYVIRNGTGTTAAPSVSAPGSKPNRFYGSVKLDATRATRDMGQIAQEVLQHLTGLVGADVQVTLEISAKIPNGVSDSVVRTVTENCRTLKFSAQEFENE